MRAFELRVCFSMKRIIESWCLRQEICRLTPVSRTNGADRFKVVTYRYAKLCCFVKVVWVSSCDVGNSNRHCSSRRARGVCCITEQEHCPPRHQDTFRVTPVLHHGHCRCHHLATLLANRQRLDNFSRGRHASRFQNTDAQMQTGSDA